MTLHWQALDWVAEKVKGRINHVDGMPPAGDFMIGNCTPDIVKYRKKTYSRRLELHEVEAINMPKGRIDAYTNWSRNSHRVLWLALPEGTSKAFHEIKLIEKDRLGFNQLLTRKSKIEGQL